MKLKLITPHFRRDTRRELCVLMPRCGGESGMEIDDRRSCFAALFVALRWQIYQLLCVVGIKGRCGNLPGSGFTDQAFRKRL